MVQYLSKFSPKIAVIAEPLWDLMKKHAPYTWGPEHNHAFGNMKKEIVQASILKILQSEEGKLSFKLMLPSKALAPAYFKTDTPSTLQVNHCKMLNMDMLP